MTSLLDVTKHTPGADLNFKTTIIIIKNNILLSIINIELIQTLIRYFLLKNYLKWVIWMSFSHLIVSIIIIKEELYKNKDLLEVESFTENT